MTKTKTIAIAALLTFVASPTWASGTGRHGQDKPAACYAANPTNWAPLASVAEKLTSAGYKVHRLKAEYACYEARVTDDKGAYTKLYLDAASGAIIGRRDRY